MSKVHIVGSGPAGCIAAISALNHGFDVVMSEDHKKSGEPENCSGLLSRDGLESLSCFVDYSKHAINPIHGADIRLGDELLKIRKSSPVAYVCNRSSFDSELASNAESHGAKINYGEKITSVFHSENVIGADGPFSAVARHFSFAPISKFATTLRANVKYSSENPNVVEVFLSNKKFPGFFAWVIPHNEESAEFGVGVLVPHKAEAAWDYLLKMKKTGYAKPRGWAIPLSVRSQTAKKNVMLVGDAAGQVKSTTGGGVIFGGNCASIAGAYADNPLAYELMWRWRFGPDLKMHGLIHKFLYSLTDDSLSALGRRLKSIDCEAYLSNYGHMDRPSQMLKPHLITHMIKSICGVA